MTVTWEDTGRNIGSSVGPNISDLTLQVRFNDSAGRLQSALIEHLTAIDRTATAANAMLQKAKDGVPPQEAQEILGNLRGGGGGDNAFTKDAKADQQGFSWPEHKDKKIPAGSSSGKGSKMTVNNGGTLDAPNGFRIVSGGSKIELTPGGILIDGPIVNVKGAPINLN